MTVSAQRVVMVHEEPRHRLIHESPEFRVLDVQIQPGDTTLFHTHDAPITYVTISTSSTDQMARGGSWLGTQPRNPPPGRIGSVRAVPSYAETPLTHRVTNVGQTLFRLIAVSTHGPGSDSDASGSLPGTVIHESRWFRHASVPLGAGEASGTFTAIAPTVLILVEDGRVAIERMDGWLSSLEQAGQSAVLEAGERYTLLNGMRHAAHLVMVEVR